MTIGTYERKGKVSTGNPLSALEARTALPEHAPHFRHFDELFHQYHPMVYGMGLKYSGNPEDAEDISQEVFTKVWKGLKFFNFQSSFKTWIYRIALNTCVDHARKPWQRQSSYTSSLDEIGENDAVLEISCTHETGEQTLLVREKKIQIRKAIEKLRPHLKTVLVLKEIEELSYGEISSALGLSTGTISSRLNRAKKALQEYFKACAPAPAHEF
jgi:RNA polymerase sigma-70 factor, ECF subfamily